MMNKKIGLGLAILSVFGSTALASPVTYDADQEMLDALVRRLQLTSTAVETAERFGDVSRLFASQFTELSDRVSGDAALSVMVTALGTGQFDKTEKAADAYLDIHPESALAFEIRGLARSYLDRLDDALVDFSTAARLAPESAIPPTRRGVVLAAMGRRSDAEMALRDALKIDPTSRRAAQQLGFELYKDGRYAEALPYLKQGRVEDQTQFTIIETVLIDAAYRLNDMATVADILGARSRTDLSSYLLMMRGSAYLLTGAPEDAVADFRALVAQADAPPQSQLLLARALARAGEQDETFLILKNMEASRSLAQAERTEFVALALDAGGVSEARQMAAPLLADPAPLDPATLDVLIRLFVAEKNTDGALAFLSERLERRPSSTLYERRASLNAARRAYSDAVDDYRSAILLTPDDPGLYRELALAHSRAGNRVEAVTTAKRLTGLSRLPSDWSFLGALYEDVNRPAAAQEAYEKALSLGPDFLASHNLSVAYARNGDFEKALPLSAAAYERQPDNAAVQHSYGWILANTGDLKKGLALLEKAAVQSPTDALLQYRLSIVLGADGQKQKAKALREAAVMADSGVAGKSGRDNLSAR
ncbi:tetratricopeptide repeat protein [Parvularcula sp. LCG005]|uniref:tetratricopeptide repeat protein n=1 Tax=Parvularcula sp. LCG005 TaxID=3078805 RepID=UPI002942ABBA|nr:tetratricopeptide repeat protein [Parvularcula sp. LCG005]WOI54493.1 tetratricopeptide repeat protein [Parvularcula sp. LCG005]